MASNLDEAGKEKKRRLAKINKLKNEDQNKRQKLVIDTKSIKHNTKHLGDIPDDKKNAVWKSVAGSKDLCIDSFNCPVLSSGIHKWSFRIESLGIGVGLGVISSEHEIDYKGFLGYQPGTWGYYNNGYAYIKGGYPKYKEWSTVKSILDLTGKGTLSFAIDNGPTFKVFSDMKSNLGNCHNNSIGFIPAASLLSESKIYF